MAKKLSSDLQGKEMTYVGCNFPVEVREQLILIRNKLMLDNISDVMRLIINEYCKNNKRLTEN